MFESQTYIALEGPTTLIAVVNTIEAAMEDIYRYKEPGGGWRTEKETTTQWKHFLLRLPRLQRKSKEPVAYKLIRGRDAPHPFTRKLVTWVPFVESIIIDITAVQDANAGQFIEARNKTIGIASRMLLDGSDAHQAYAQYTRRIERRIQEAQARLKA